MRENTVAAEPLSPEEEALYREGLRDAPTVPQDPNRVGSLLDITVGEWADRCRRLLATLDDARRASDAQVALWADRDETTGCLIWRGRTDGSGYASMSAGGGRPLRVSRVVYEFTKGPIPRGLFICHTCDNPPCINPAHLYAGTRLDNARDAVERGRMATGDRHGYRTRPERQARAERHGAAHLTNEQAKAIFDAKGTESQRTLAARYGVSQTAVCRIQRGQMWRDVTHAERP